jgi:hypothetical protein
VGQALNRLAETLKREEELRKENLADLAHELRTPVMGILGRMEAAQDGVMDDERANLEAMHDETLRLVRLLGDLTALSEAERPGLLLRKEHVDLAEIARGQISVVEARFEAKGLDLAAELESVSVEADPQRLQQVVANLLANALRYETGRVGVRTGRGGRRRDGGERPGSASRRRLASHICALLARREVAFALDGWSGHRPGRRRPACASPRWACRGRAHRARARPSACFCHARRPESSPGASRNRQVSFTGPSPRRGTICHGQRKRSWAS